MRRGRHVEFAVTVGGRLLRLRARGDRGLLLLWWLLLWRTTAVAAATAKGRRISIARSFGDDRLGRVETAVVGVLLIRWALRGLALRRWSTTSRRRE